MEGSARIRRSPGRVTWPPVTHTACPLGCGPSVMLMVRVVGRVVKLGRQRAVGMTVKLLLCIFVLGSLESKCYFAVITITITITAISPFTMCYQDPNWLFLVKG